MSEADLEAIRRGLHDYAAAIDERDYDGVRDVFTYDAVLDYTSSGGPRAGLDETVAWLEQALAGVDLTMHYLSNIRIDLEGDAATSHAYFWHPLIAGGGQFRVGGTYRDRWRRTPDGWRISERRQELAWSDPQLPTDQPKR